MVHEPGSAFRHRRIEWPKAPKSFKPPYLRDRRKGGLMTYQVTTKSYDITGSPQYYTLGPWDCVGAQGSVVDMQDIVTPGGRYMRLVLGRVMNNPMIRTETTRVPSLTSWQFTRSGTYAGYHYFSPGAMSHLCGINSVHVGSAIDKSGLIYRATLDARSRVAPAESLVAVTIAEFGKSIGLVAETAEKLANAYRYVRSGGRNHRALAGILHRRYDPRPLRRHQVPDAATRFWLEARYGWGPMLNDIVGTAAAIGLPDKARSVARGQREDSSVTKQDTNGLSFAYPFSPSSFGTWNRNLQTLRTVKVRAYVLYEVDLAFQPLHRFGVTSMPESLWEIVPFSFVADWFVPVGDWLKAVTPKLGVTELATGYTEEITTITVRTVTSHNPSGPPTGFTLHNAVGSSDSFQTVEKRRVADVPILWYPPIDVKLNVKRAIDAISLLLQNSGSTKRLRV